MRTFRIYYRDNNEYYGDAHCGSDARSALEAWLQRDLDKDQFRNPIPKDGNYEVEGQAFQVKDRKIEDSDESQQ